MERYVPVNKNVKFTKCKCTIKQANNGLEEIKREHKKKCWIEKQMGIESIVSQYIPHTRILGVINLEDGETLRRM